MTNQEILDDLWKQSGRVNPMSIQAVLNSKENRMVSLNSDQRLLIDRLAMRDAFDYAMACHSDNERGQSISRVRFETMIDTLRVLGFQYTPCDLSGKEIQPHNLFGVGNELYNKGYRREGAELVLRISNIEGRI